MLRIVPGALALVAFLAGAIPARAAAEPALFLRELTQLNQPWAEASSGKVHVAPRYSPLAPVKVDLADGAFSISARQGAVVYSFTVAERSAERIVLSTPVNETGEKYRHVYVSDPKSLADGRYTKAVPRNAWSPVVYEQGYGGRRWELWWGDAPPAPAEK